MCWSSLVGVSIGIVAVFLYLTRKFDVLSSGVATNDLAVYFRALANSLGGFSCPDNLAIYFLPKKRSIPLIFALSRKIVFWKFKTQFPLTPLQFFSARAVFFDQIVVKSSARQLVLIGTGYDTRPYRLWNGHTTYELDLPHVVKGKERAVRELNRSGIISDDSFKSTKYLDFDATSDEIGDILKKHGFDWTKPSLFLIEGVSYYIPKQLFNKLLTDVGEKAAPGSVLAFDYLIDTVQREEPSAIAKYPFSRLVLDNVKRKGEPMITGYNRQELIDFASRTEMKVDSHVQNIGDLIGVGLTGQEFMPFVSFKK